MNVGPRQWMRGAWECLDTCSRVHGGDLDRPPRQPSRRPGTPEGHGGGPGGPTGTRVNNWEPTQTAQTREEEVRPSRTWCRTRGELEVRVGHEGASSVSLTKSVGPIELVARDTQDQNDCRQRNEERTKTTGGTLRTHNQQVSFGWSTRLLSLHPFV